MGPTDDARLVEKRAEIAGEIERGLAAFGKPPYLQVMPLDLSGEETAAPVRLLTDTIDRYPLSPRIATLKSILSKIKPQPVHEPLPPPKVYAPPRAAAARRRRRG